MSIDVTNKVWLRGPQDAKQLLLLMAIADHANEKGAAFPGVELLAQKSRQSTRNALRGILKLEREGWIFVHRRKHGDRARGNEYLINLARLTEEKEVESSNVSPHDTVSLRAPRNVVNKPLSEPPSDKVSCREITPNNELHEVTKSRHEVTESTSRGDKTAPRIENRKEPSLEPSTPPTPLQGDALATIPAELLAEWRSLLKLRNRLEAPSGRRPIAWDEWWPSLERQYRAVHPAQPAPDAEFAQCVTAREAANLVMKRTAMIGERLAVVIAAALSVAVTRGGFGGYSEVGELAWKNYAAYQRQAGELRYSWGPRKFFAEGHWINPSAWPRGERKQRQ